MSLIIGDRINKATKARRFRLGTEPDWVGKASAYPNANTTLPSDNPDAPVEVGTLEPGDASQIIGGSHGLVKAPARNGFALINDGGVDRYVVTALR